eukprot:8275755-Pyramimonas_sp.AAC.1
MARVVSMDEKFDLMMTRLDGMGSTIEGVAALVRRVDILADTVDRHGKLVETIQADLAASQRKLNEGYSESSTGGSTWGGYSGAGGEPGGKRARRACQPLLSVIAQKMRATFGLEAFPGSFLASSSKPAGTSPRLSSVLLWLKWPRQ